MATGLDISGLTLEAQEVQDMSAFIVEQVFNKPELRALHGVFTGVKMKEQIVFASQFSKMGMKKGSDCSRQNSGASSTLTQKYWEPNGIEDTLVICPNELDSKFKAYFTKIRQYKQRYEIEGSDLETFFVMMVEEAIQRTIWRAAWLGDTSVAASGAATAGLKSSDNVKFYDYIDGLFAQIFAAVTAGDLERYTIDKNAETTTAAQTALDSGEANDIFEGMWALADPRLKANPNAKMYVTNGLFENQRQYLESKSLAFTIERNMQGFQELTWQGFPIVNMETVWDLDLLADFEDNSTNNAYYLPNRAVFTVPENVPVATLSENDLSELEIWYDRDNRQNKIAFGFDLDAKLLEEYMAVVAY